MLPATRQESFFFFCFTHPTWFAASFMKSCGQATPVATASLSLVSLIRLSSVVCSLLEPLAWALHFKGGHCRCLGKDIQVSHGKWLAWATLLVFIWVYGVKFEQISAENVTKRRFSECRRTGSFIVPETSCHCSRSVRCIDNSRGSRETHYGQISIRAPWLSFDENAFRQLLDTNATF